MPILSVESAMKHGAMAIHEEKPDNVVVHSSYEVGSFEEASQEPDLIKIEGHYETPIVSHCHIETAMSFAYLEAGKIVVVSSTQIPHIVRRICTPSTASGPWTWTPSTLRMPRD